jgi:hypothetical protein
MYQSHNNVVQTNLILYSVHQTSRNKLSLRLQQLLAKNMCHHMLVETTCTKSVYFIYLATSWREL